MPVRDFNVFDVGQYKKIQQEGQFVCVQCGMGSDEPQALQMTFPWISVRQEGVVSVPQIEHWQCVNGEFV